MLLNYPFYYLLAIVDQIGAWRYPIGADPVRSGNIIVGR